MLYGPVIGMISAFYKFMKINEILYKKAIVPEKDIRDGRFSIVPVLYHDQ